MAVLLERRSRGGGGEKQGLLHGYGTAASRAGADTGDDDEADERGEDDEWSGGEDEGGVDDDFDAAVSWADDDDVQTKARLDRLQNRKCCDHHHGGATPVSPAACSTPVMTMDASERV